MALKKDKKEKLNVFKFINDNTKAEFVAGINVGAQLAGKKITVKTKMQKMLNEKELVTFALTKGKGTQKAIDQFEEVFTTCASASRFAQSARIAAAMFDVLLDAELKKDRTADSHILFELTLEQSSPKAVTKGHLALNLLNVDDDDEDDSDDDIHRDLPRKKKYHKKPMVKRKAGDYDDDDEDEEEEDDLG